MSKQVKVSGISHSVLPILLLFQCFAFVWHAYRCSPVFDEFGHFYSGLAYLQSGNTQIFNVNPPLCRAIGAFPGFLVWDSVIDVPHSRLIRYEFSGGRKLFLNDCVKMQKAVFLGRLLVACFGLIGTVWLYCWGESLISNGGRIAASLFVFQPQLLGHGSLLTSDVPLAVSLLIVCHMIFLFVGSPTTLKSVAIGLSLGLAISLKFTALVTLPLVVFGFAWSTNNQTILRMLQRMILALSIAWLVVSVPYGFEGIGKPMGKLSLHSMTFNRLFSSYLGSVEEIPFGLSRILQRNPLPEEFILGLDRQQLDFEQGLPSFAAGSVSRTGWWWFYMYSMLVKMPVGTLILAAGGLLLLAFDPCRWIAKLWVPLSLLLAIFTITAVKDGFAQQHRYILSAYPLMFLILGVVFAGSNLKNVHTARAVRCVALFGILLSAGACIVTAPNWLSSFNVFAGGNITGYKTLFNDASDWGQDTYLVASWLRKNRSTEPVLLLSTRSGYTEISACGGSGFQVFTREALESPGPKRAVLSKSDLVWLPVEFQDWLASRAVEQIGGTHIVFSIPEPPTLSVPYYGAK